MVISHAEAIQCPVGRGTVIRNIDRCSGLCRYAKSRLRRDTSPVICRMKELVTVVSSRSIPVYVDVIAVAR